MKDLEQILEEYKESAFSSDQPILREIFNLSVQYPNDFDLGKRVRDIMRKYADFHRERLRAKNDEDLKRILNELK